MHRRVSGLLLAVAASTVLTAVPSEAAGSRVVLVLRPAAPLQVERPPADEAERAARAARSTPTPAARSAVRDWLLDRGFTVDGGSDWTVSATGPAHLVTRRLPAELRATVLSAVPDSAAPMAPRAVPVGWSPTALRDAYDVPAAGDGAGTTVASIQFSGWRAADAEVFARAADIPLAPGQITTETVLDAVADRPDGEGGEVEVALDVETVLGAAPRARQRVFVAPNTARGAVAVYDAVATAAERDGLTAVSISWGACEPHTSPSLMSALELALARAVAAGATVTAASGDAGAYGCSTEDDPDGRLAVDYPASSPSVLAVGGTSLRLQSGTWTETAWSEDSDVTGHAGSGSGGGYSARFGPPVWQRGRVTEPRRAVPDVAAVADPRTGIGIYTGDGSGRRGWQVAGGTSASAPLVAGQLASALSALGRTAGVGRVHVPLYAGTGGFRDVVTGDNHRYRAGPGYDLATGLGSPLWEQLAPRLLQPALVAPPAASALDVPVAAYAPVSAAARYGTGESAEAACAGADATALPTTVRLAAGPDRVVPLTLAVVEGGACRTTARPVVLDRTAPTAGAALARTSRAGVLQVTWRAADAGSGVAQVSWAVRRTDTGATVATGTSSRTGSVLRALPSGRSYRLEVLVRDAVGLTSAVAVSPDVPA